MSKTTKDRAPPKTIPKLVRQLAPRHSTWQVFADFVEMAITLSNVVDLRQRDTREARYLEVVKRYKPDEVQLFPEMFPALVLELEKEPHDVLGMAYHELELHNKWAVQYFTPDVLCRAMAKMIVCDAADVQQRIAARGFLAASEPCAGSGAVIIALSQELREQGVHYQKQLHVTAVDAKCVYMTYAQLALLHIPAVIVHGDSLSLEEYGQWYTPAHILDGWGFKLRRAAAASDAAESPSQPAPQPDRPASLEDKPKPIGDVSQLTLF